MLSKKCRLSKKKSSLFFLFLCFFSFSSLCVSSHTSLVPSLVFSLRATGIYNTRREEERLEGGGRGGAWLGGPGNPEEEEEEGRRRSVGRTTNRIGINIINNNNTEIDTERITTITITTTESNAKKARRTSPCSENNSIE